MAGTNQAVDQGAHALEIDRLQAIIKQQRIFLEMHDALSDKLIAALRDAESLIDALALACCDRVDSTQDPRRAAVKAALAAAGAGC